MRRPVQTVLVLFVVLAADWLAFRMGWVPLHPQLFAGMAVLLMGALAWLGGAAGLLWGRQLLSRGRAVGILAACLGMFAILGGGLVNWLFSIQAAVILNEQDVASLGKVRALQELQTGPLARLEEMRLVLALDEVELVADGPGFYPRSHLRLQSGHDEPERFTLTPTTSHRRGSLRFFQGMFGFSPRIVVTAEDRTLFDAYVPFLTRSAGSDGSSFSSSFEIGREGLAVEAEIGLGSLDERMRGHVTLNARVLKDHRPLGQGRLLPGQFADLDGGYRLGFTGLKQWAEIDISRRNYPHPILAGAWLLAAGLATLALAWWRGW